MSNFCLFFKKNFQTNQRGQSPYPPPIQSPGPSPYPGSQQPQQAPGIANQGAAGSQPPQGPPPPQQQYSPFPQRYPTPPSSAGQPQSIGGPHNHRAAPYPPHQVTFSIKYSLKTCLFVKIIEKMILRKSCEFFRNCVPFTIV